VAAPSDDGSIHEEGIPEGDGYDEEIFDGDGGEASGSSELVLPGF
jgi:hypothetical protein